MRRDLHDKIKAGALELRDRANGLLGLLNNPLEGNVEQPKPAPCRCYGQCQHPAKPESQPCCGCSDHEPDVPEQGDAEARLEKAGAKVVSYTHGLEDCGLRAFFSSDSGSVWLCLDGLTLDRAEAALQAATGRNVAVEIDGMTKYAEKLRTQLAAAQAEVKRLTDKLEAQKRLNAKEFATVKLQQEEKDTKDAEIARLRGEIAEAREIMRDDHHAENRRAQWLARNDG